MSDTLFDLPPAQPNHSATYTDALLTVFARMLRGRQRVLDPFGGKGGIFLLEHWLPDTEFQAVEIEPEWAACHPKTTLGNALALPWPDGDFDAICTSPAYGNRMADQLVRPDRKTSTYAHDLQRKLHRDSGARLQWGDEYKDLHRRAWIEARRVLRPGSLFVLNIKDHFRNGVRMEVTAWHETCLNALGFETQEHVKVQTPGIGYGANRTLRVPYESVILLRLAR